jgi:hypothetical protein
MERRLATGDRAVVKNLEQLRVHSFCDLVYPQLVVVSGDSTIDMPIFSP